MRGRGFDYYGPMYGMGGWFPIGLLVTIIVVGLVLWLVLRNRKPGAAVVTEAPPQAAPLPDALRILDERLARGDIDVDDYAARRRALTGEEPPV